MNAPLNLSAWIQEHRDLLKPPVNNKMIWEDGDFIVMVVGGPNVRKDYHVEDGPEYFHMIEGDMVLRVMEDHGPKDIPIKEGEVFLLPPHVPHSPQRFEHTLGLVIERKRRPEEQDGFMWFCDLCHTKLHETYVHLENIETQLPPIFDAFFASEALRTCKQCGHVMSKKDGEC